LAATFISYHTQSRLSTTFLKTFLLCCCLSLTAYIFYHAVFDLSTTFFFFSCALLFSAAKEI
ncbi:MAG: hypothetical protein LUH04_07595, partial [Clostridium sp.]|nr:hypothetical protein [Clostridium sp.]